MSKSLYSYCLSIALLISFSLSAMNPTDPKNVQKQDNNLGKAVICGVVHGVMLVTGWYHYFPPDEPIVIPPLFTTPKSDNK